jgi:hypothetical protein
MKQLTLATEGFERYGKTTRRAVFLNPVFQESSACPEKHDREAFESDAGQRSRAIEFRYAL